MKKNLLSIIILALLVVNIALTAVMMLSVVGASKKTSALVDDISKAISLDLSSPEEEAAEMATIPMTDIDVYNVADSLTIPLKMGDDGEMHYCLVSVALSINNKHEDYATYGSDLSAKESLIKDAINTVIQKYTMEEAKANQEQIRDEILEVIQKMFGSDFIFDVAFSSIMFQ